MREKSSAGAVLKGSRIARRFRYINIIFLVLIFVLVASVVTTLINGVTGETSENYARFYSQDTVEKFGLYLNHDLSLVEMVANVQAVKDWFADESDEWKRYNAYIEMINYAEMLHENSLYFGVGKSLNKYMIDAGTTLARFKPFELFRPGVAEDEWFFECVTGSNSYTLNVDVDEGTQTRRLWINHKVEQDGVTLGVFCAGLPFDTLINDLFDQYKGQSLHGFIIDGTGRVQMDSAYVSQNHPVTEDKMPVRLVSSEPAFLAAIDSHLATIQGLFDSHLEPQVVKLSGEPYSYMSIAPIAGTDWSVVTFFDDDSLFSAWQLLPLLLVLFCAFVLYAILGNTLISRVVLHPLKRLTNSVSEAGATDDQIYGIERDDEFGELAQTILHMRDRLKSYNEEILQTARERDRQSSLLHAVNAAAAVLLSAADVDFADSLRDGIALMANCLDVDRIFIWQNELKDGQLYYVQKFEWLSDIGSQGAKVRPKDSFSYAEGMLRWETTLCAGKCINGPLYSLSAEEQENLAPYGIRSILVIPVFFHGNFWGFVSFDDCHNERTFAEDEISILRSGSLMMVSSLIRNEASAQMREADERTRLMLNATPLCCNIFDKDLNIVDCNDETIQLFGLQDKTEYQKRFFELSPPHQPDGSLSVPKAREYIREAFTTGWVNFEWMHQNLKGESIPCEITLVRLRHGKEYIVTAYTRDLRKDKEMLREIEYKDTLLHVVNTVATTLLQAEIDEFEQDLWQCMGMMAEAVGVDRVYIWQNHTMNGELYCSQLYEWSEGAEPQQGKQITIDISYRDDMPKWTEKLSRGECINNLVRNMPQHEFDHLAPRDIKSILVVPVFLRDQFWGFVGFDDCHRERIFSENEESILRSGSLLIANALLRNEMTQSIRAAVSQLEEVAQQAQDANRAKSNFLSNMSHEMRTPMNAIIGMTTIGKSAADLERKDYAFGKIEDASNHLLGVINDVLDMSKIEANKFSLSEEEFSFEKMLQRVVNVINFRVDEKHQRFSVYLDKNIPQTLIGDDIRLAQVITNLLANAVKFTPEHGSIRLSALFICEEQDECTLQINVADTGIGISQEQQSRLFNSFEQAESSTTRKFGGTGLGLAISKHIVELMGGRVWIESDLGKGSTFSFTVLLKRGRTQYRSLLDPGVNWGNVRMLAVDDDPETREYFTVIAAQLGLSCDTAASAAEAMELINTKGPYDLYFVDWNMPGVNGVELTGIIKEQSDEKCIVVMISAAEWSAIEERAHEAGVDTFLPKPLFVSTIAECINRCLGGADSSGESIVSAEEQEAGVFAGYHVLLAEDVEINREIVLTMLEPTQLHMDCAANGLEAVRMFSAAPERYDMIFMDVQMPEMDGLEATRTIRALDNPWGRQVPIVAMTANVFREDIEVCMNAGMNDHVGKPLDFDEVMELIKRYLPPK